MSEIFEGVKKGLIVARRQKLVFMIAWKWEGYPRCINSILEDGGTYGNKNLLLTTIPKNKCLQNIRT